MNILLMLVISLGALVLGYVVYARYIAKVFHASDLRPTPATRLRDGVDYVPTPFPVLFSHHFATIAGAGPIVGPTIAAVYGIYPALAVGRRWARSSSAPCTTIPRCSSACASAGAASPR